jgi:hypothetical protein
VGEAAVVPERLAVPAARTTGRTVFGVLLLLAALPNVAIMVGAVGYATLSSGFHPVLGLLLVGLLPLGFQFWAAIGLLYLAGLYLDGRTFVWRDGPFLVTQSKWFGVGGLRHRVNVDRLIALETKVDRYKKDDIDPQWRPLFRPRVTLVDGSRRLADWGTGLTVGEGNALASDLLRLVEQAHLSVTLAPAGFLTPVR